MQATRPRRVYKPKARVYARDDGSVIGAIERFWKENGYSPTIRDLMEMTGIRSTATMHARLTYLKRDKLIKWVTVGNHSRILKSLR